MEVALFVTDLVEFRLILLFPYLVALIQESLVQGRVHAKRLVQRHVLEGEVLPLRREPLVQKLIRDDQLAVLRQALGVDVAVVAEEVVLLIRLLY